MHVLSRTRRRSIRIQDAAIYSLFAGVLCLMLPRRSAAGQSTGPVTVAGVVLNVVTNQPVARALVRVGSHAALTQRDGRFEFSESSGSPGTLQVTKPGFYDGLDGNSGGKVINFSATATEEMKVYLYPEALITGTLTAPNGEPLAGVSVQALRKAGEEEGGVGWVPAAMTMSNADGEFRVPLPAGDYVVETQFAPNIAALQKAVLPLLAPEAGNSIETGGQPTLHLTPGSEQRLDLRPEVRSAREVHIRVDGGPGQFMQIEAHLGNGLSFKAPSRPSGGGEMTTTLPVGHYTLTASDMNGDGESYGEATIDVPDSPPNGDKEAPAVALHVAKVVPLGVELAIDPSSSTSTSDNQSSTPPNVQQLGLHFVRVGQTGARRGQDGYLRMTRNNTPSVTLLPGTYRLMAQPLEHWVIESANIGGTDLMTQELDLEPGGTATPLRIMVSNQTASVKGTVKLDGEPGSQCWVYLLAASTGVTPVILSISGSDGSFSKDSVPPGSYRAVAFEGHYTANLNDAAKLERLAPYMKSFSVAAGETSNLDLDAVPTQELMR